jgi:hypothetical protein
VGERAESTERCNTLGEARDVVGSGDVAVHGFGGNVGPDVCAHGALESRVVDVHEEEVTEVGELPRALEPHPAAPSGDDDDGYVTVLHGFLSERSSIRHDEMPEVLHSLYGNDVIVLTAST